MRLSIRPTSIPGDGSGVGREGPSCPSCGSAARQHGSRCSCATTLATPARKPWRAGVRVLALTASVLMLGGVVAGLLVTRQRPTYAVGPETSSTVVAQAPVVPASPAPRPGETTQPAPAPPQPVSQPEAPVTSPSVLVATRQPEPTASTGSGWPPYVYRGPNSLCHLAAFPQGSLLLGQGSPNRDLAFSVQAGLASLGYDVIVDGDFGSVTAGAVARFQTNRGLVVDGKVGQQTWALLRERMYLYGKC